MLLNGLFEEAVMCVSPITLRKKVANKYVEQLVPCGKCPECLKRQQNDIALRSIIEGRKYGSLWFITLTYSNKSVPKVTFIDEDTGESCLVNTLCREHIKKWKRDVRQKYFKEFGRNFPKFSFLICGEYGPRTFRPHYHGVLFGLDKFHADYLKFYWESHFGFTTFLPIDCVGKDLQCVSRYVSKYCVKPAEINHSLLNSGIIEKPRKLTSIGFGLPSDFDSLKDHILQGQSLDGSNISPAKVVSILSRLNYPVNGVKYSIPLYLRKKLFYEIGINENLVSSPLSKLLSSFKRVRLAENEYRELSFLVSGKSEREAFEAISRYIESKENGIKDRRYVANASFKRAYQSSRF